MENIFAYQHKCCEHCSNNPANNPHATGICHCALPDMERGGSTGGSGNWTTTTEIIPQETIYSTSTKGPKE